MDDTQSRDIHELFTQQCAVTAYQAALKTFMTNHKILTKITTG